MRKIGSYTFQKGAYFSPSNLQNYIEMCLKAFLVTEKWWKQQKFTTDVQIIIKIKPIHTHTKEGK